MTQSADAATQTEKTPSKGVRSALALALICVVGAGIGAGLSGQKAPETVVATSLPTLPAMTDIRDLVTVRDSQTVTAALRRNDNLLDMLVRMGADRGDAYRALQALYDADLIDPRRLRPGLELTADIGADGALGTLTVKAAADHSLIASKTGDDTWMAAALNAKLTPAHQRVTAEITTSIYDAARAEGASDQHVVDFASIFAYDIDFQREIHPGDRFEITYEAWVDERGNPVKTGNVLFAKLEGKATTKGFYRHTPSDDGVTDYFDKNGESATRFLMKTPINGARLSSHFGKRRHPISGYSRLHKGTDFAARSGTPIYAAGHGVIERASRYGGYGKYVRIRHANGYKTAYAHMRGYGRGIKKGRRVRQGDVIGYVGSTGASTGPHLHYEVLVRNKHVNAMRLDLPTGRKLADAPAMLSEFTVNRVDIDRIRQSLGAEIEIAATAAPITRAE